jgi:serine/threonine protein kinase
MGRGGMADVYAARPESAAVRSGKVAVKRMRAHLAEEPRLVELFLHEAELASRLVHPNLVRCLDFGTADGVPFMALEFVDGVPVDALQRWLSSRAPMHPRFALAVAAGVLRGLEFAHSAADHRGQSRGIVHLDVAPDNILLSREGLVKLADFGVARSTIMGGGSEMSELCGKPGYMSPEQIMGMPTDRRSDVFSAGVVLTELLTGSRVFEAQSCLELLIRNCRRDSSTIERLGCSAPKPVADLVLRATAREPDERFRSCQEFLVALEAAARDVGGLPTEAEVASWLREQRLVPHESGVFDLAGREVSTEDLVEKIDEARPTRGPNGQPPASSKRRRPSLSSCPSPRSPRFRLLDSDQQQSDPLSLAQLVERIVTGRVELDTQVAALDGPWMRLRDVPLLAAVARKPAYRFDDGSGQRADWREALERARVPAILAELATRRARGLLSFSAGARRKRVYFDDGLPVFVSGTDRSELLGQRLVAMGLLSNGEVAALVERSTELGVPLGQALVKSRVLPAGSVLRLLAAELERRVLELGTWMEGEVSFTSGARAGMLAPAPLGPPAALTCRLVRTCYCDPEVASFLPEGAGCPLAASRRCDLAGSRSMLTALESSVIGRAVGYTGHEDLVERLEAEGVASPPATRRALFLGLSVGLLVAPASPRRSAG